MPIFTGAKLENNNISLSYNSIAFHDFEYCVFVFILTKQKKRKSEIN